MASKISGGVNHPVFVNRQSAEQAGGKAEAKQLPNARAARDTRFDGLGGADRAEMLRFMALKDGHQEQQGGAQAAVRNLGAATPLLFANQPEVSLADAAKGQFANYDLTTFDNLEKNVIRRCSMRSLRPSARATTTISIMPKPTTGARCASPNIRSRAKTSTWLTPPPMARTTTWSSSLPMDAL
jgi:hypothetical protein